MISLRKNYFVRIQNVIFVYDRFWTRALPSNDRQAEFAHNFFDLLQIKDYKLRFRSLEIYTPGFTYK